MTDNPVVQYRCHFSNGYVSSWRDYNPNALHATLDIIHATGARSIELREKQDEAEGEV